MDKETLNTHLNRLEEFINDEDKIVTVPWLCTALNVNVKESKSLLETILSNNRKTNPGSLAASYILSGVHKNVPLISIVKEEELDDKKDLYSSEPIVEIYSVQKSKELDFNSISLVDNFDINNPKETPLEGSVVSQNCIKRQIKVKPIVSVQSTSVKEKPSLFAKVPPKTPKLTENISTPSPKSNAKSNSVSKSKAFTQYFTKVENKNAEGIKIEKTSNVKQPQVSNGKIEKEISDVKTEIKNNLENLVDPDDDDEVVEQTQPVSKSKNVKRKSTKKGSNPKRRKRIVVEEESDEDIFANDDEDEEDTSRKRKNVILDSEDDEPIIKQEPEPILAPKNKKRKLVDKTFEDEEGYVITKKEWVEESGSEEEVTETPIVKNEIKPIKEEIKTETEAKSNKPNSDVSKAEKTVNGKTQTGKGKKAAPTNQPTLMNFFKRK